MSDPRKIFVCRKCGHRVSDKWGNQTPCDYCVMKEYMEKKGEKKDGYMVNEKSAK